MALDWIVMSDAAQIRWVLGVRPGRLAVFHCPVWGYGNGLDPELRRYREAGVDIVVSLQTETEQAELELTGEGPLCRRLGMDYVNFPIEDHTAPPMTREILRLIEDIVRWLREGKTVLVHCRAGMGRSAVIAACAMISMGASSGEAFDRISESRGFRVPELPEQVAWVHDFELRARDRTEPGRPTLPQ